MGYAASLAVADEGETMSSKLRLALIALPLALGACVSQETGRMDFVSVPPWSSYNQTSAAAIEEAGSSGDAAAARLSGDMYYWGDAVEPDRAKAAQQWTLAAQGGDAVAVERLDALKNGQPIKVVYDGGGLRRFFNQMGDQTFAGMDEGF
jgi:hypothetical protein